jgi:hypothetical protein
LINISDYPYLYETHLHTCQGSACAVNTGAEMAKAAKEAGYAGIIVTEHNWGGNTAVGRRTAKPPTWEEWVSYFIEGYLDAKAYGDKNDLDVFWGYEAGYNGTEFLIYGIEPKWLIEHPEIKTASVEQQYSMIHEAGGMVVHAHPFREETYIPEIRLYPDYVDAVEGINAAHSNPSSKAHNIIDYDIRALEYANSHKLPITAGSDIHSTNLFCGGVAFRRRLTSIQDYCKAILSGEDYILTNGVDYFSKFGEKI